jgi:hypothetical protein
MILALALLGCTEWAITPAGPATAAEPLPLDIQTGDTG